MPVSKENESIKFVQINIVTSHRNGSQHHGSDSSDSKWKKANRQSVAQHTYVTSTGRRLQETRFNPDEHGLKFQRNVLDLTLQWRFSSLPNNAKLEVVPSNRKQSGVDSTVRIALQMEDGSRLQGSFSSGQTLWDLLTHFPQT
ncbi:tether containing UBX domain for GLUT4, partial [Osmerus eperlanus]|uniref:tether containing UBX domain for GLUT4 n=1 Tax=Osmerus eperlanus TaxID=29151 RepID=UPI002E12C653